jgi:hypothetical protein
VRTVVLKKAQTCFNLTGIGHDIQELLAEAEVYEIWRFSDIILIQNRKHTRVQVGS